MSIVPIPVPLTGSNEFGDLVGMLGNLFQTDRDMSFQDKLLSFLKGEECTVAACIGACRMVGVSGDTVWKTALESYGRRGGDCNTLANFIADLAFAPARVRSAPSAASPVPAAHTLSSLDNPLPAEGLLFQRIVETIKPFSLDWNPVLYHLYTLNNLVPSNLSRMWQSSPPGFTRHTPALNGIIIRLATVGITGRQLINALDAASWRGVARSLESLFQ